MSFESFLIICFLGSLPCTPKYPPDNLIDYLKEGDKAEACAEPEKTTSIGNKLYPGIHLLSENLLISCYEQTVAKVVRIVRHIQVRQAQFSLEVATSVSRAEPCSCIF